MVSAMLWQSFLLRYGKHSSHLREAVAALTRRIANTVVDWNDIRALMANQLIPLDKCPGVRPIGVGECLRRVLGKTMSMATGSDVVDICGIDQLASGLKAGIEGVIHVMSDLYEENAGSGWGLLLVDAKNAFNVVSRVTALWNARILWPRCSRFLFNTYRGYSMLLMKGSEHILYSKEGITQGDPLSMLFYAVAVLPLIQSLKQLSKWHQSRYADDSACAGKLQLVRNWFDLLLKLGPSYGYFPEPSKCFIIVAPSDIPAAHSLFKDLGYKSQLVIISLEEL